MRLFLTGFLALTLSCGFISYRILETVRIAQCTVLVALAGSR
jgi:hypothetical protein